MDIPRRYSFGQFEFIPRNFQAITFYARQKNSNFYEYLGACTVAIVMLEFFNLEDLPGPPPQRLRFLRDTTTFSDM